MVKYLSNLHNSFLRKLELPQTRGSQELKTKKKNKQTTKHYKAYYSPSPKKLGIYGHLTKVGYTQT
jgi:hypothetical protein